MVVVKRSSVHLAPRRGSTLAVGTGSISANLASLPRISTPMCRPTHHRAQR